MILSIGMIVKNEERYLRRCLEAISPLLHQLDSELIIADTGSTDNTISIAREFTDQVFSFEWCNDFSAARNSTLNRAKGAWFMSLDADEIFTNVTPIIDFFQTGEYRKFNSANYVIRNSNDISFNRYSDYESIRMSKRLPQSKFVNAIHEVLKPLLPPMKHTNAIALHYGYMQDDNESIQRKFERNISLLNREIERDPENSKHYYNLSKNYLLALKSDAALESCTKGLNYASLQNSIMQYPLYTLKAQIQFRQEDYPNTIATIHEYFTYRSKPAAYDLEMYCYQGHSYFHLEEYEACIAPFQNYLASLEDFLNMKYQGPENAFYEQNNTSFISKRNAVVNLIRALMKLGRFQEASHYNSAYCTSEWYQDSSLNDFLLNLQFEIMRTLSDYSPIASLYHVLEETDHINLLHEIIELELKTFEAYQAIVAALATSDLSTDYIALCRLRHSFVNNSEISMSEIETFFEQIHAWSPLYADALYFAVCNGCNVSQLCEKISLYDINSLLFQNPYLHFSNIAQRIVELCNKTDEPYDLTFRLWLSLLCFNALYDRSLEESEVLTLLHRFGKESSHCLAQLYRDEVLADEQFHHLIPKPLLVGYYFYLSITAQENKQKAQYIGQAIKLHPEFADAAKVLMAEFRKSTHEEGTVTNVSLGDYAQVVKNNINTLIQNGQTEQAAEILNSYEQLCPDDPDLIELKKHISS